MCTTTVMEKEMVQMEMNIFLLVKSFFNSMTEKQWKLLEYSTSDLTTRVLMAKLIMDIIRAVSKELLITSGSHRVLSHQNILASLGNTVSEAFEWVLNIKHDGKSDSSARLSNMIAEEVLTSVNSAFTTAGAWFLPHIPPCITLNKMIEHGLEMTKEFMAKKEEGFMCLAPKSCSWQKPKVWKNPVNAYVKSTIKRVVCWASRKGKGNSTDGDTECLLEETMDDLKSIDTRIDQTALMSGYEPVDDYIVSSIKKDAMPPQNLAVRENAGKAYVESTVKKLVCRAFGKCRVNSTNEITEVIVQRLVDKTWAKVEGIDFDGSRKTFPDKKMFRYVTERMGTTAKVQEALLSGFEPVDNYIVSSIKQHVMPSSDIHVSRVRSFVRASVKGKNPRTNRPCGGRPPLLTLSRGAKTSRNTCPFVTSRPSNLLTPMKHGVVGSITQATGSCESDDSVLQNGQAV
ncbi:uncharacterized protein AB9W97_016712 [Spinachia spinachia]